MFEEKPLPPFVRDPFNPVLIDSPGVSPYTTTIEQDRILIEILALASSDSRFAEKAYLAIRAVIGTGENPPVTPPVLTSLEPATKPSGSVSFKMKCKGQGFDPTCVIHMNGNPVTTRFNTALEIETDVNLVGVPAQNITVVVRTGAGAVSNSKIFTVTAT